MLPRNHNCRCLEMAIIQPQISRNLPLQQQLAVTRQEYEVLAGLAEKSSTRRSSVATEMCDHARKMLKIGRFLKFACDLQTAEIVWHL